MKYIFILFLIQTITMGAQQQFISNGEKINQIDPNSKKQGLWKLTDETSHQTIVCEMDNGNLASDIHYYKDSIELILYKKERNTFFLFKDKDTLEVKLKKEGIKTLIVKTNADSLDLATKFWFMDNTEMNSTFYGGFGEMNKFIVNNVNKKNIGDHHGMIKLMFDIDANGYLTNISVVEGKDRKLIREAIRIVSKMPPWQPAHQRGIFVKTSFTLPIKF